MCGTSLICENLSFGRCCGVGRMAHLVGWDLCYILRRVFFSRLDLMQGGENGSGPFIVSNILVASNPGHPVCVHFVASEGFVRAVMNGMLYGRIRFSMFVSDLVVRGWGDAARILGIETRL